VRLAWTLSERPRRCAADYKIGFVNTERLFREAAPAKRAQQKLEKEFASRDSEIQKLRSRCATCRRCSKRTA
jgi:outer membrane protein